MIEQNQTALDYIHATLESTHETLSVSWHSLMSCHVTVSCHPQSHEAFTQYKNYGVGSDLRAELEHSNCKLSKKNQGSLN